MGKFSSDRAIQDYAQEYWDIESTKVKPRKGMWDLKGKRWGRVRAHNDPNDSCMDVNATSEILWQAIEGGTGGDGAR